MTIVTTERAWPSAGLSDAEAARRLAEEGPNELPTAAPRGLGRQAWDVIRQPMLLLLLGAGTVNFLLGEPRDGAILLSFVLVVIAISISQEHRTERALTALRDLSSPRALVLRDGRAVRVAGREVVRGDLVVVDEGDRVPADALLVEAVNLSVDEAALTGESVPVRKVARAQVGDAGGVDPRASGDEAARPGGDETPWLFSGTLVVKGRGTALVKATGARTELGRIGSALSSIEPERTPLQREVDRLVGVLAVVGIGAAAVVVVVYGATRHRWLEGLRAGIGTAMAMLPEEFPVVLSVFLALGAWRMSQRHVLARRSAVIETLGSATAICVDKTGTLTLNTMSVRELVDAAGRTHLVDEGPLPEAFVTLAATAALASPTGSFDPTDRAFEDLAATHLGGAAGASAGRVLVREYPLSDGLLAVTHVWRSTDGGDDLVAAKGAPEAIADLCRLDGPDRAALRTRVETATARGLRVLGVARATASPAIALPGSPRDFAFELAGLAGLHDPVRPGVPAAVAECRRAGVRVVMITGDYPGTALAIAKEIGLGGDAGCVTGPELEQMDDAALAARVRDVAVFARMVPEQKLRLVRALQANGEVVGMTGDGVNDAPALRAAHIGIAMGARGTDVAREAAALVITDDDFTSIAGGVRQGRGVFDNLRKAMAYTVAVHVPIFGMSLLPLFAADWPLVLLPVQIAFLELIIDPACSVVFESEQIDPAIMDAPPRRAGEHLFSRRVLTVAALQGLSVLAFVAGVFLWGVARDRPDVAVRSMTFATLVAANLSLILTNRSWRLSMWRTFRERRNPTVPWILLGASAMLVVLLTVPGLRSSFDLGPIQPGEWAASVAAGVVGVAWFEVYKLFSRRA